MNILVTEANSQLLEVFSSKSRIRIIELLNERPMNINELSAQLQITPTITARHIRMMEHVGIVECETKKGARGLQKLCYLSVDNITLQLREIPVKRNSYFFEIGVGQYVNYKVTKTCGLASKTQFIGVLDDTRYFSDPAHVEAVMVWTSSGYIEYRIPNLLMKNQIYKSIEISLEICSEAPHFNENWPSDISFEINGYRLGTWTCPGDYGGTKRGLLTPEWWPENMTNHGLLKNLCVNSTGSYLDGLKISGVSIEELDIKPEQDIFFKIINYDDAENIGGFNIFGRNFGNYSQDINVTLVYDILR